MLSEDFAWSCTGPCGKLLKRSWWNPLGVLTLWSRTGPCEKILWRSCWSPPQEVLALRSCRCSALVLVWKFFWDVYREVLVWRSCEILYIDLCRRYFLWRLFKILLDVLIWGSGMRSWQVDIVLLLVPKQVPKLLLLVSGTLTSYPPHCLGYVASGIWQGFNMVERYEWL